MLTGQELDKFKRDMRTKMLQRLLRELRDDKTTMGGFEEDLALRLLKAKGGASSFSEPRPHKMTAEKTDPQQGLPSFLKHPHQISRINSLSLRDIYRNKSKNDLAFILQDDKIYNGLVAHIKREGKATNRVIESFLASPGNYRNGLTKGITNYNIRDAVKAFGQKLEQEDFIQNVQQGAVKVRKLNADFERVANLDVTTLPTTAPAPQQAPLSLAPYLVPRAA